MQFHALTSSRYSPQFKHLIGRPRPEHHHSSLPVGYILQSRNGKAHAQHHQRLDCKLKRSYKCPWGTAGRFLTSQDGYRANTPHEMQISYVNSYSEEETNWSGPNRSNQDHPSSLHPHSQKKSRKQDKRRKRIKEPPRPVT